MGDNGSVAGDFVRGAIAGAAATWVMDLVTTGFVEGQSKAVAEREAAARPNGQSAVGNLVDRIAVASGTTLSEPQKATASQALHYSLGILPGAMYGVLRSRLPLVGAWGGLVYGVVLWAVNDEYANARLGLSAPPDAYPPETHLRGLVGHLVLGETTDTVIDVLGG